MNRSAASRPRRGLRARIGRAGSSATPTSYAARAGLEAVNALTFEVDPSVGAGHYS